MSILHYLFIRQLSTMITCLPRDSSLEQYSINIVTGEQSLSVFSCLMINYGISDLECYSIFVYRPSFFSIVFTVVLISNLIVTIP